MRIARARPRLFVVAIIGSWLWATDAAAQTAAPESRFRIAFDVGAAVIPLTTGDPFHVAAVGAGLILGLRVGGQVSPRVGLYYLNRTPLFLFVSRMPGLGIALDCFDFNAFVVKLALGESLSMSLGPSFDFMVPFFGNRAFGGGFDLRVEYQLANEPGSARRTRTTIGFDVHPSFLDYNEKHDYFSFLKTLVVIDLSIGVQWL